MGLIFCLLLSISPKKFDFPFAVGNCKGMQSTIDICFRVDMVWFVKRIWKNFWWRWRIKAAYKWWSMLQGVSFFQWYRFWLCSLELIYTVQKIVTYPFSADLHASDAERKIILSGSFNPLHDGHLKLLEVASRYIWELDVSKWLVVLWTYNFICFTRMQIMINRTTDCSSIDVTHLDAMLHIL